MWRLYWHSEFQCLFLKGKTCLCQQITFHFLSKSVILLASTKLNLGKSGLSLSLFSMGWGAEDGLTIADRMSKSLLSLGHQLTVSLKLGWTISQQVKISFKNRRAILKGEMEQLWGGFPLELCLLVVCQRNKWGLHTFDVCSFRLLSVNAHSSSVMATGFSNKEILSYM